MIKVPFVNKYTHRTATKESTCWVCGKFSTAVLTANDLDFFFVCLNHLSDISFCKPILPPAPSPTTPSPTMKDDQKAKAKKEKDSKSETDSKDETKKDSPSKKEKVEEEKKVETVAEPPKPKEFILDSRMFFMRENQYKKKIASQQAKQLESSLPSAPRRPLP